MRKLFVLLMLLLTMPVCSHAERMRYTSGSNAKLNANNTGNLTILGSIDGFTSMNSTFVYGTVFGSKYNFWHNSTAATPQVGLFGYTEQNATGGAGAVPIGLMGRSAVLDGTAAHAVGVLGYQEVTPAYVATDYYGVEGRVDNNRTTVNGAVGVYGVTYMYNNTTTKSIAGRFYALPASGVGVGTDTENYGIEAYAVGAVTNYDAVFGRGTATGDNGGILFKGYVNSGARVAAMRIDDVVDAFYMDLADAGLNGMYMRLKDAAGASALVVLDNSYGTPHVFYSNGTYVNKGDINVLGGKVGIGVTSPEGLFQVGTNPNGALVVRGDGKIGIGTTGPTGMLHVGPQGLPGIFVNATGTGVGIGYTNPRQRLEVNGVSIFGSLSDGVTLTYSTGMGGIVGYQGDATYNHLDLRAKAGAGSQLFVHTGGNVGVGMSIPIAKLDVRGPTIATTAFAFRIADSTPTDRVVVLDNGNVGIGTTAPTITFSVNQTAGMSSTGAHTVRLLNKSGTTVSVGHLVIASTSVQYAFQLAPADSNKPLGAVIDSSTDGGYSWIAVGGLANVLLKNATAATTGYWCGVSDVLGRADCSGADPASVTVHEREVGHCLQNVTADNDKTAYILMHFN